MIDLGQERQESASFFEKKEPGRRAAKKLSLLRALATIAPTPKRAKVFLVTFFSKKVTSTFL